MTRCYVAPVSEPVQRLRSALRQLRPIGGADRAVHQGIAHLRLVLRQPVHVGVRLIAQRQ